MCVFQPASLVDLTETYHLLPIVLWFVLVGVFHTLTMLISYGFRCISEVVEAFYDFRIRCGESKRRYLERSLSRDHRTHYP